MARDGQGNYNPPLNNWNPALDGNEADPAGWNQMLADLAAALTQSVSADGQTMLTGNLKMGGNTLQGMGAPSANGQALRRDQLIKGPNIASASTITIPVEGSVFEVTGTTTINQLSGAYDGRMVVLVFQDELIIKHGPNLQLPNATDITTKAGDAFVFYRKSSSEWAALFRTAAYADLASTAEAQALASDVVVITPKKLGDAMNAHVLGVGQTWQDMTGSRTSGTTYTNTTGRIIFISVSSTAAGEQTRLVARVDGVLMAHQGMLGTGSQYVSFASIALPVPAGSTYSVTLGGTASGIPSPSEAISGWLELR